MHDIESRSARHTIGGLAMFASCAFVVLSMNLNYKFGVSLGTSPEDGRLYGIAAIFADLFLIVAPFVFFWCRKNRIWLGMVCAGLAWLLLLAFAFVSAIGHAATNRLGTMSARQVATTSYEDVRKDLTEARKGLGFIPAHRPIATIQAEIERQKLNIYWSRTNECNQAWGPQDRKFCQTVSDLRAEMGNAMEGAKLQKRIDELQAKSDGIVTNNHAVTAEADPQSRVLSALSGLQMTTVQGLLIALVVTVVIFIASFGPYMSFMMFIVNPAAAVRKPIDAERALITEKGLLIDISPNPTPTPPPASAKPIAGYLPSPAGLSDEAKEVMRAIGMPTRPGDKRPKDSAEVVGWRMLAWMLANNLTGDFTGEDIEAHYAIFVTQDNRTPWDATRQWKGHLENTGARFVRKDPGGTKPDGSRGTVWTIRKVPLTVLMEVLRKRGVIPKDIPPPEPEPAVEPTAPAKNVFKLFGRSPDTEEPPKKATSG